MTSLLLFYRDRFGIEYPTKVDFSLNKETKPKQTTLRMADNTENKILKQVL